MTKKSPGSQQLNLNYICLTIQAQMYVTYVFWVGDIINLSIETGSADDEGEVPDWGKRKEKKRGWGFDDRNEKYQENTQKSTHNGSFKSKSIGVGGLFGDCQNKPVKAQSVRCVFL